MKLPLTFLFEITIDFQTLSKMSSEDRYRLRDLARYSDKLLQHRIYVFHLSDINKIRNVLNKYGIKLRFPARAELKRYGLSYSGLSLEVEGMGDSFKITQYFPDGREEVHIIPQKRVWRVYYLLKEFNEPVEPAKLWEKICKEFGIDRFFDRSGKFHKNSFFGDRRTYFDFYYFPIKVLEHIGKVRLGKKLEVIK